MLGETEGWKPLDPRVKQLWIVQSMISAVILPLVAFVLDTFLRKEVEGYRVPFGVLPLAVLLVSVPLGIWLVSAGYNNWRYVLRDHDLVVAHGIFWKTRRYISRPRIQHLDVTAGPIARGLGIEHVNVYVGGHTGPVASIPGLGPREVEELRRTLVRVETPPPPVVGDRL
ncbi:MAG: PH domain-containing protein [Fimbriimonadaceae bacterium]|nr:PH domain-containing protein [Fimbriimonadaceae bacterium]QYK54733.1 MAG: PH domain-containing protein [Fimbriimonadaceae bacterium]